MVPSRSSLKAHLLSLISFVCLHPGVSFFCCADTEFYFMCFADRSLIFHLPCSIDDSVKKEKVLMCGILRIRVVLSETDKHRVLLLCFLCVHYILIVNGSYPNEYKIVVRDVNMRASMGIPSPTHSYTYSSESICGQVCNK